MMLVSLYVRYEDVERYIAGEEITATIKENSSEIFNVFKDNMINILVDSSEILRKDEKIVRSGMVRGTFIYYVLQKVQYQQQPSDEVTHNVY